MSLSADILWSYRAPRQVLRGQLAAGKREDRALVYLMVACLLIFVAQWPGLARAAELDPSVPFEARMGGALMGVLFVLPLLAYVLSLLLWLALRPFGPISAYGARLAFFWALLAVSPLMLIHAALASVVQGAGLALQVVGMLVLLAFLIIFAAGLRAAFEAGRAAALEAT